MTLKAFDIKKTLLEMGSIIFAVLFALYLENWQQDREREERANIMLSHINAEIRQNLTEMKAALDDNHKNIDMLQALLKEDNQDLNSYAPHLVLSGGSTANAAWNSAQVTDAITVFPIETVTQLASLYDTQEYYVDFL